MISNLAEYFLSEQEFYLNKINYNRLEKGDEQVEYALNYRDNIEVKLKDDGVELVVERLLKFNPEEIFELSVSFGAVLKFDFSKKEEYDWEEVDLAEEFRENGGFVMVNLMNRISLVVAEITASFGQQPIILPPIPASKNK